MGRWGGTIITRLAKNLPGPKRRGRPAVLRRFTPAAESSDIYLARLLPYSRLLKTPRAFVVYARGGTYAEDSPTPASRFDHQKGYIDFWLKFIGVKEVHTLVVEGTTWGGKEKGEESIARGQEEAKKLAADF